jgi:hypothetical protein
MAERAEGKRPFYERNYFKEELLLLVKKRNLFANKCFKVGKKRVLFMKRRNLFTRK